MGIQVDTTNLSGAGLQHSAVGLGWLYKRQDYKFTLLIRGGELSQHNTKDQMAHFSVA